MGDLVVKKKLLTLFYISELILYIVFILADLDLISLKKYGFSQGIIKYISICFLFVAAVFLYISERKKSQALFSLIMGFTIFSDYFLLFSENILPGILSFCAVQILYIYFILKNADINNIRQNFAGRLIICFAAAIAAYLLLICFLKETIAEAGYVLIAAILLYAVLFTGNVLLSFRRLHLGRITAGLVLFYLCDINVLLFNLPDFLDLPSGLCHFCLNIAAVLMWVFYLPGKILIFSSQTGY